MNVSIKNKKSCINKSLPEKIENYPLGKLLIFFCDILLILIRKCFFFFSKETGNIIIVSLHRLGDTVLTIPAIKVISKHYEDHNKIIICYPESKNLYGLFFEGEIITLNKNDFKFGNRIASSAARKILRNTNSKIIFDLTGAVNSASLIFNSNASQIIGMNDRIFKNIYDQYTRKRKLPHLMDTYLDVANLVIHFERLREIYEFNYPRNKNRKILIHPFAGWKAKEWNLKKYIQLGMIIKAHYDIAFIYNNLLPLDVQDELNTLGIEVIITNSVDELVEEIKECSLIISNDSGPIYIANILGIPTFTIYGPTNPSYSIPFGKNHDYIQKKIKCSPEENRQYCFTDAGRNGCPSFECMNLLSVKEVVERLNDFFMKLGLEKI